mgnify:CR=1 FL=1
MQNIKKLKTKTIEGIEVKNYQTFPSMEWGENGGLRADIYYKGKYVVQVYNEGNGGMAIETYQIKDQELINDFKKSVHSFLLRNDKNYGPNSEFKWLRDKTAESIDGDDLEEFVNLVYLHHEKIAEINKGLKKGYAKLAVCDLGYEIKYYHCSYIMDERTFKEKVQDKKCTNNFKLYTLEDLEKAI